MIRQSTSSVMLSASRAALAVNNVTTNGWSLAGHEKTVYHTEQGGACNAADDATRLLSGEHCCDDAAQSSEGAYGRSIPRSGSRRSCPASRLRACCSVA